MSDLQAFANAVFSQFLNIWHLYTTSIVLGGVIALWLLRRVAKLFGKL